MWQHLKPPLNMGNIRGQGDPGKKGKMSKREVIRSVLDGNRPPYVPWNIGLTKEAREKLDRHFGDSDMEIVLDNHFLRLGSDIGFFTDHGENRFEDVFGVIWDRSIDKDIGNVANQMLLEPTLENYEFPNPLDSRFFQDIPERIQNFSDCFRVFQIGFSLYERAWSMRGWESLMMDFIENPDFVNELFHKIADYNIAQINEALKYDIDAVYFGDDWGMQVGLQMGPPIWYEFIYPALKRMYGVVRDAGKYVMIHSCGDVDELFDYLIKAGVNCFNPFQPEVMDVSTLLTKYRRRLTFHGGLSTQRTLPYGTVSDVRVETNRLLELGGDGNYIFAPAHDVEGDVPLANLLTFIDIIQNQTGYRI